MKKKIKERRSNARLFYGIFSILEKEFSQKFNSDELLNATDDFIKVYDGSVSKKIIKEPRASYHHGRDSYSVICDTPWSLVDDGYPYYSGDLENDHECQDRIKTYLNQKTRKGDTYAWIEELSYGVAV